MCQKKKYKFFLKKEKEIQQRSTTASIRPTTPQPCEFSHDELLKHCRTTTKDNDQDDNKTRRRRRKKLPFLPPPSESANLTTRGSADPGTVYRPFRPFMAASPDSTFSIW